MSVTRAVVGLFGVATVLIGFTVWSRVTRRRWFPAAPVPLRYLIDVVLTIGGVLGTSLVLGSIGRFEAAPLVATSAVVGVGSLLWARTASMPSVSSDPPPVQARSHPRWTSGAMAVAVGIVAIRWIAELIQTVSRGFSQADELHYHLTHAALFAQTGHTWPIHFTSIGDGAAFHPAHAELLHAVLLVVFGSDFLSIFLNLVFVALALGAAWTIGDHAGNAPAGALVMAAVLSLPLVTAEAGSALNDTMATAFLLTAVAFLLEVTRARTDSRYLVLAGIAAGIAAGTKLTVLVPVVLLAAVVAGAAGNGRRLRSAAMFVGAAVVSGGYWFARNLAATGNPVPALSLGPLPGPDLEFQRAVEFPVLDYVTDGRVWHHFFLPGVHRFFGPLWPILPGLALLGALAVLVPAMWRKDRRWPLLAACGLLAFASYLATPTSAAGRSGAPVLFAFNLRYAVPALVLCALAGLAHPVLRRNPAPTTAIAGVVFVVANLHGIDPTRGVVAGAAVGLAAAITWVATRGRPALLVVGGGTVVLGLAGAVALNHAYLDRRWTADLPRWHAFHAGDEARHTAIGLTGFPQSYPFYGADLSNRVVTIGDDSTGDELLPFTSCTAWWSTVTADDLDVVVVLSEPALAASRLGELTIDDPMRWLRASGAPVVLADPNAFVFDVRSVVATCP